MLSITRHLYCCTAFAALVVSASVLPAEVPLNGLTEGEKRGGWKLIFDGQSTKGWRNYKADSVSDGWRVNEGVLEWTQKGAGDIITEAQYDHFELSIEYRISKGGNSGIMFHVTEAGKRPWHTGPEIQIQDNVDGHDPQKSGWLYQLYKPKKPAWAIRFEKQVGYEGIDMDDATRPPGEWNHVYLRVAPNSSEVAVNGVSYFYFNKGDEEWDKRVAASKFSKFPLFGKAEKGHICLQDHGNPVAFRNIKIRELTEKGEVRNLVEEELPLAGVPAFPELTKWEGYEPYDSRGRQQRMRQMVLTHAGDGSGRLFTAIQRGAVYVFPNDVNVAQAKLFLDIRSKVQDWRKDNEEGLLGLAFHPNYPKNGEFFVYYSSSEEPRVSIVSRFRVSKDNPNVADPASEEVVMKIPQPFSNHNGGSIAFGPDHCLYIALGDGGGRNDPLGHGQRLDSLMGCILRIDVDRKSDERNYAIPEDNPFVDRKGARPEIYAYGFRNVWRMTFDRETGRLWAADVGQDLWEEVNIVKAGGNYGWSVREASYPFNNKPSSTTEAPVEPIWEYDHRIGKSITGGYVYRGKRLPELQGAYLYADFISGRIWALRFDETTGRVTQNARITTKGMPIVSFGEDAGGEVYYTAESNDGQGIFRLSRQE